MKKILLTATAILISANIANANGLINADANARQKQGQQQEMTIINEGSQAPQNVFEGSDAPRIAPGMGSVGGNSTAHCVIANGFGVVGPGAGVQFSSARISEDCMTEREAGVLLDLLSRPASPARTAAIYHFCTKDDSMKDTLVNLGYCEVRAASTAGAPAVQNDRQTVTASYSKCELENGQIRLSVRSGADRDTAISQCKAKLGY